MVETVPVFADDTGAAQTWTVGDAVTSITVPAATGTPTPTYAAVGSLPDGIAFDTSARVISGTPTAVGNGTITIRATNSAGSDDWTVEYTTSAADLIPTLPTIADQTGTVGVAFSFALPDATGGDPPITYALTGTPPDGIDYIASTRTLEGTHNYCGDTADNLDSHRCR